MDDRLTLYHDGSCPLCRAEIAHYRRQRGSERLAFTDVSDVDAEVPPSLRREAAMARFHVREPDGRLLSGAQAFVAVWSRLPRWRWAARLAGLPGVTPALEVGYRMFLPLRPKIAKIARIAKIAGRLR